MSDKDSRAREHTCEFKMADEAMDVNVPRFSSELRSMRCEQCLLNKTDGSANFSQGKVWFLLIFGSIFSEKGDRRELHTLDFHQAPGFLTNTPRYLHRMN